MVGATENRQRGYINEWEIGHGWRTRRTGVSPVSSGGVTEYPHTTAMNAARK